MTDRREPDWLNVDDVLAIHREQLALFGGSDGLRDRGLLESAMDRPRNRWHYGEDDLAALAAAYAFGLSRNHPFVDGNKRVAFAAMMVFLRINGVAFKPPSADATAAMLDLASGEMDDIGLARWIKDNWPKET